MAARWQYHIVNIGIFNAAERMAQTFGRLGSEGWELVAIHDKASNWLGGMEKGFAVFKRQVDDGAEPVGAWAKWEHAGQSAATFDTESFLAGPKASGACIAGGHGSCRGGKCTCSCHTAA